MRRYTIVELYAGIARTWEAFRPWSRCRLGLLADINQLAIDNYTDNYPSAPYIRRNLHWMTPPEVEATIGGKVDILLGCPPCQGFSDTGKRDADDPRNAHIDVFGKFVKGTFYAAVEELESLGILSRERRRKGNRTNLWTLDIKKMESLRVSWQDIKPQDAGPEEGPTDGSGMGLPKNEDQVDEAEIGMWASEMNSKYELQPGTDDYWTLSKVLEVLGTHSVSFARFKEVVEGLNRAAEEGRLHLYYPSVEAGKTGHLSHKAFMGPAKFPDRAKAWDRMEKSVNETNFNPMYAEE